MDHTTSAADAARHAIAIAHEQLSPTMRAAARVAPDGDLRVGWTGFVAERTQDALARRGVVSRDRRSRELTTLGRMVHAVLMTSAAEVLAWAGRRDAETYIATGAPTRFISELADDTKRIGTPATDAYRETLLDELHTRALAEDAERSYTCTACGERVEVVDQPRHVDDECNPHALHTGARNSCPDDRCRAYLRETMGAAKGPHFCNPACYASHATPWDLAGDAAELCDDLQHFALYPDTTPESTAAHVAAHL